MAGIKKNYFLSIIIRTAICVALIVVLVFISQSTITSSTGKNGNVFSTAKVSINLNDGIAVFDGNDIHIVPDDKVERGFFIRNESTCGVYYRIYIENLKGPLASYLVATIFDKDGIEIYSAAMPEFSKENTTSAFGELATGETKEFVFRVYCPKDVENADDVYVEFDIKAEAVQAKNNPDGVF